MAAAATPRRVVAGFDPPATRFGSGHRGVDLAGAPGAVVRTALAGTVTFAGRLAGRGVVVVNHGATRTTYEPVTASVHVGDHVATGAVVGRLQLVRLALLPPGLPALGADRGRGALPRPAHARRGGPGPAAAAVRLAAGAGPTTAPALALPGLSAPPVAALLRPPGSGAGVGLAVGPAQPVGGDVGVDLRGGQ